MRWIKAITFHPSRTTIFKQQACLARKGLTLTQDELPAQRYRWGINIFLVFIGAATLLNGILSEHFNASWSISEWLINYEGGFVRRGLSGEAGYLLGHLFGISPVFCVVFFYLSLYGVLLLAVRQLVLQSSLSFWVLAVMLSPATFSFQVLDMWAGFRKEVIYIAALSLLLALLQRSRLSAAGATVYIAAALSVAILCHEPLICFAPYFFAALVLSGFTPVQAARQCAIPFALGVGVAFLCARHPGNMNIATQICSSVGYKLLPEGTQVCADGAITHLSYTSAMAAAETRHAIQQYGYYRLYPCRFVLVFIPAILGSVALYRRGFRRNVKILWLTAAASFVASLLLFVFAMDWGRWIYIHAISISLLLLFMDGRDDGSTVVTPVSRSVRPWRRRAAVFALAVYATFWTLPGYNLKTPRFGYVGLVRQEITILYRERATLHWHIASAVLH